MAWYNKFCVSSRRSISLKTSLEIIQIIVSITLVALVLMQGKGGGLGGIFGSDTGVYKTRRGVEKVLFQATIGVSIVFFLLSLLIIVI